MTSNELKKEFSDIMNSYLIQINHLHTINQLAVKYLYDYPNKLPIEIQKAIKNDKEIVLKELDKSYNLVSKFKSGYDSIIHMIQNPDDINSCELQDPISFSIIELIKLKEDFDKLNTKTKDYFFDFEYSINAQSLLMLNATFEGFLKQITQFMFKLDDSLKERRLKKVLNKRLEFLQNECKFNVMDNPHFLNILRMLEQLRHIIVHNNGNS